jgi:hypothetical protein
MPVKVVLQPAAQIQWEVGRLRWNWKLVGREELVENWSRRQWFGQMEGTSSMQHCFLNIG